MKGRPTCSPWSHCHPLDLEDFVEWWPHLCEGPRGRVHGFVSQSIDRNWTQMRIEHLHPALVMAYTGKCSEGKVVKR